MPETVLWRGRWPEPEVLRAHAAAVLAVELEPAQSERLLRFLRLLERWAARFNLISVSSRQEVVDRHLLDSLALLRLLDAAPTVVDFGSGAGFPGIPLAVIRPGVTVCLVESRAHRANFLRAAVRELALTNATIFEGRGQAFAEAHPRGAAVVVARAVRLDEVAAFANAVLARDGRLLAMTKRPSADEPLPGFEVTRRSVYRLPNGSEHALFELVRR